MKENLESKPTVLHFKIDDESHPANDEGLGEYIL